MAMENGWKSTLSFRRFRRKLNELSMVHWTNQIGADSISKLIDGKDDSAYTVDEIGCSFDRRMFPRSVSETHHWLPVYMERTRLHLLVLTAANLESFLQEVTFVHLAALGYVKRPDTLTQPLKLNAVGEAIGKPILGRASLPEPLRYAEQLFGIDYGAHRDTWTKAYKLRCIAAHTGGMVYSKHLVDIPDLELNVFEMIGLDWDELLEAMRSADNIASQTDRFISSNDSRQIEAEQTIRLMKAKGELPKKHKLWQAMHDLHGVQVNKASKLFLEEMFY